jgi:hypothetical protein
MARAIIHNGKYRTIDDAKSAINRYFAERFTTARRRFALFAPYLFPAFRGYFLKWSLKFPGPTRHSRQFCCIWRMSDLRITSEVPGPRLTVSTGMNCCVLMRPIF